MTLVEQAAASAAVLIAAAAAFQLALAAGLPLGNATMGGRAATVDGVLQPRYRAIAVGSAAILVLAAWIVLGRAGMVPAPLGDQALDWAAWIVAGFLALNTVTNLSGRHPLERWGLSSMTLVTALLVAYVAYAAPT
jgi:hypothetical protein